MNILTERKFNKKTAVVIGKFDGVHKGHQHLMSLAADVADEKNLVPMAYTFPNEGNCIITDKEKTALLSQNGIEAVYYQEFTEDFKNTTPEEFVRILTEDLSAKHIIVGFNFRFGKGRCGSAEDMAELCRRASIGTTIAEPVLYEDQPISSTRIRNEILKGNIQAAFDMMGRHFAITAPVGTGKQLGRQIGFPTANMSIDGITLLPQKGVYATAAETPNGTYPAITNIGSNPTVDTDGRIKAETHIIGYEGDLYSEEITVKFMEKLRDERRFKGTDALSRQLAKDSEAAVKIFQTHIDK